MNKLNKNQRFILFCLENYKINHRISGAKALHDFQKYDVFSFLEAGFDVLHTQSRNYLVSEINQYIKSHHATVSRGN